MKRDVAASSRRRFEQIVWALWAWLLQAAFRWRLLTLGAVFIVLCGGSYGLAVYLAPPGHAQSWLDIVDTAGFLMAWVSLPLGWAFALLAWANRKHAAAARLVESAGTEVDDAKRRFNASVVLVSPRGPQVQWHLRHIQPERTELVFTSESREAARKALEENAEVQSRFSPASASNDLDDPWQVDRVRTHCETLLRNLLQDYRHDEICVDLTAGTAPMSVGAFQAAQLLGVASIYLRGKSFQPNRGYFIDETRINDRNEATLVRCHDPYGPGAAKELPPWSGR